MKIIVGLGNPGPKYETTRHNAGFLAVDRLIDAWKAEGPDKTNMAEVYKAQVKGEKVYLLKPQTYMNKSGQSVGPFAKFFKAEPTDIIVIHDDLDLKPLTLKIKTGGGNGGHNGLKSIDACMGAGQTGYHRIRVGIGKPSMPELGLTHPVSTVDWVLHPFSDDELRRLDALFDDVVRAAEKLVAGDVSGAMNEFNKEKQY